MIVRSINVHSQRQIQGNIVTYDVVSMFRYESCIYSIADSQGNCQKYKVDSQRQIQGSIVTSAAGITSMFTCLFAQEIFSNRSSVHEYFIFLSDQLQALDSAVASSLPAGPAVTYWNYH